MKIINLIVIFFFIVFTSCVNKNNPSKIEPQKTVVASEENYQQLLNGRFILSGSLEAGYIFKPDSDTVFWINEMNAMYPDAYKIQWITENVFLYEDFRSTKAGVIRTFLNKVISYDGKKLMLVAYPTGNCYMEPDQEVKSANDTLHFEKEK